jgi:hypothetical protein
VGSRIPLLEGVDPGAGTASAVDWRLRRARIVLWALALGLLVATFAVYVQRGLYPADEITYIAAGERLNAGHELYALVPGDREVALKPPYWTVPLLSPPFIAVVWRPLAALPGEAGIPIWWALTVGSILATIVLLAMRRPATTAVALIVLNVPLVYELAVGNVNGILLLLAVATWWALARGHDTTAGAIVALMAAFKLTPIVLGWYLVTQRRWRAVGGLVGAGLLLLLVSVVGAGFDAHLRYLEIVRQTNLLGSSDLSLAGIGRAIGMPADVAGYLPTAALVTGLTLMAVLRSRPGISWAIAIFTVVLGSPVVNINWYAFLLGALAPLAWPMRPTAAQRPLAAALETVASGSGEPT